MQYENTSSILWDKLKELTMFLNNFQLIFISLIQVKKQFIAYTNIMYLYFFLCYKNKLYKSTYHDKCLYCKLQTSGLSNQDQNMSSMRSKPNLQKAITHNKLNNKLSHCSNLTMVISAWTYKYEWLTGREQGDRDNSPRIRLDQEFAT